MRLSELLTKNVVDGTGERVGRVHDVRIVQDGPVTSGFEDAFRVHGLIVGQGALANRLGYGRTGMRGPWLVRVIFEARHKPMFVPWQRVRTIEGNQVVISGTKDDLERATPARGATQEEPA